MEPRLEPVLEAGAIHIWSVRLDGAADTVEMLRSTLSSVQLERCERFRFEHLRRNYAISQGLLRCVLGAYLRTAPAGIQFRTGERGKPFLSPPRSLGFNLSHSGGLAALAVAADQELGVDVEVRRDMDDIAQLARHYFSPGEMSDLMSLPLADRNLAFFRCWTRKEAFLKATGEGLYFPLDRFRVSLLPGHAPELLEIDGTRPADTWNVSEFLPTDDHVGAVMWKGPRMTIRQELFGNAEKCLERLNW